MGNSDPIQEAVDCLIKLHDADPHAIIDTIRAKIRDCAVRYEVRCGKGGGYAVSHARKRLADAFINQVPDTPLSRDISEEIKNPTR